MFKNQIAILMFLLTSSLYAKGYEPRHVSTQTGSYAGTFNLGIGYQPSIYYANDHSIGVTNFDLIQLNTKHVITSLYQRVNSIPFRFYGGGQLMYLMGDDDVFTILPSKYPSNYYPPTAFRTALILGLESKYERFNFFFEYAALDFELETYYRSKGNLYTKEIGTYGFGFKYKIKEVL
jgi:hypothetical protein